jgi:hypothetical protein
MSNTMTIETKLEGKKVSLELNQNEVASAISVCEKNSVEELIAMKRPHKGGALFFIDPKRAAACQDRHKFEHSFTVKLSELKKFKPSEAPAPVKDKKDEEIEGLKDLIAELRKEIEGNEEKVKAFDELSKGAEGQAKEIEKLIKIVEERTGENEKLTKTVEEKTGEIEKLGKTIEEKDTEIGLLQEENEKLKK